MTERLYYSDATLLDFTATVIGHDGDDRRVILDRTAFYPTSGGQPHDIGLLGGARVIDVIDQDVRIVHVVDRPVAAGLVHGSVDPARRRDHMQQHSAQHLLSALAEDRWQWPTVSVHFGAGHSTIEFATATVTDVQLRQLEDAANEAVAAAFAVRVAMEEAASAAGLRKPTDRQGLIRVVTIDGVDRSACGGTHVRHSSEIGPVRLTGTERIRGRVRVAFLAGDRVLAYLRAADDTLRGVSAVLNCAVADLTSVATTRQDEVRALRDQLAALEAEVAAGRVDRVERETPRADGALRRAVIRYDTEPASLLRQMAVAVADRTALIMALVPVGTGPVYLATSADSGVDAGAVLKPLLAAHGGRGGGSARLAQGSVGPDQLAALAAALISP